MNWNSHEFIWLDWTILAVGIVAVIWAVWRSVQKDKRSQQGASSEDYWNTRKYFAVTAVDRCGNESPVCQ